ncbi:MAG: FtsX-like permease family protein [Gaiellaceae bacterium]
MSRRIAYVFFLVRARLARRAGRVLLVVAGIAAGAAVLACVLAGAQVMQDRSLARAVATLSPADRSVQAVWFGTNEASWQSLDRIARPALEALGGKPVAVMLYREASVGGRLVDIRAVDGLGRFVRVTSGRLPRRCTAKRCEVLEVGGSLPVPHTRGLPLVVVGHGIVLRSAPFAQYIQRPVTTGTSLGYHTPQTPPLVIADGVNALSHAPELETFYRSYAWMLPLTPESVHPWTVSRLTNEIERTRSGIETSSTLFQVDGPIQALQAAATTARASERRLLLLGGQAVALLLAFTLLAAASLRRDVEASRRRLAWLGAPGWQLELGTLAEAAAVAVAGTIIGGVVGIGLAAALAGRAGSAVGAVLAHSALSFAGLVVGLGLALVATLLITAVLRAPSARVGGVRVTIADVAAIGALVAIVIGVTRGPASTGTLASGSGTGLFLLLLPGLVALVAAVVGARLLAPVLRAVERTGRRGPISARLAALSLARNPGHATVAAVFLVVSLGLALFAGLYRSTLLHGEHDAVAYAVPADYVLRENPELLVPVAAVKRPAGATPVLRLEAQHATVLGIPAKALPGVDGWRSDFSSSSLPELARRLTPAESVSMRGKPLGRVLRVTVSTTGNDVLVNGLVRTRAGTFQSVPLGATQGARPVVVSAAVPAGSRLVELTFGLENRGRLSSNGGTGYQPVAHGSMTVAGDWQGWHGTGGVRANVLPARARLRYLLTTEAVSGFRATQPTDTAPIPAVVTPVLANAAGPGGLLPLEIQDERLTVKVVGVVDRFPSVTGDLVLLDGPTAQTALDTLSPGLGAPSELWVNGPRPSPGPLDLVSQASLSQLVRSDPLARGALIALTGAALVALALALLGLVLVVSSDLGDESGELFDLETQGAEPATLRRHLRLRVLFVTAFGIVGGLLTGVALGALVLNLVKLTAGALPAQPPLVLSIDWALLLLAVAAFALLAVAIVALVTWAGFRSASAGRFREVGA